jgi:tetratricopeptide (TPR) repeat protein
MGNKSETIAHLTSALKYSPNTIRYKNRAYMLMWAGRYQAAIKDFNVLIKRSKKNSNFYQSRAAAYYKTNQLDKAVADYSLLIDRSKKDIKLRKARSFLYSKQQKWDQAVDDYSVILSKEPKSFEVLNSRGFAYLRLGKFDLARRDLDQSLAISPDYILALFPGVGAEELLRSRRSIRQGHFPEVRQRRDIQHSRIRIAQVRKTGRGL